MRFYTLVAVCAIVSAANAASLGLPSYIKTCKLDDTINDCATKHGKESLKKFLNGDSERGIPKLEPLHLKKVNSVQGGNLNIILKNLDIEGLSKLNLLKVEIDGKNRKIKGVMRGDLVFKGKYEMDGRLLILPITGNGGFGANFKGCLLRYEFDYKMKKIDGKDHLKMKNTKLVLDDIKGATYKLENLFGGNAALGDSTNQLINDSWKEVTDELNPGLLAESKKVIDLALQKLWDSAPFDEVFPQ